jgi:hypothetical protein
MKSLGLGIAKGIPDVILAGCAVSDILILSVFSLLFSFLAQGRAEATSLFGVSISPELMLIPQVGLQIVLGVTIGLFGARILEELLKTQGYTRNATQKMIIAGSIALALIIFPGIFPYYSGYLAVATMGLFLVKFDMPLARVLRGGFDVMWIIAEIVLFVLLGAAVPLVVLGDVALGGLLLLAIGLIAGRSVGLYLSSLGSNLNKNEKYFLLPATMAKATAPAAVGALPLAAGIEGGDIILAMSALSILTTAPIGAWLTQFLAPIWLARDEVDPTKVAVSGSPKILVSINTPPDITPSVLQKAADLARRSNGKVIIATSYSKKYFEEKFEDLFNRILADIKYTLHANIQFTLEASEPLQPVQALLDSLASMDPRSNEEYIKEKYKFDYVVIGNKDRIYNALLGSSSHPVISVHQPQDSSKNGQSDFNVRS